MPNIYTIASDKCTADITEMIDSVTAIHGGLYADTLATLLNVSNILAIQDAMLLECDRKGVIPHKQMEHTIRSMRAKGIVNMTIEQVIMNCVQLLAKAEQSPVGEVGDSFTKNFTMLSKKQFDNAEQL